MTNKATLDQMWVPKEVLPADAVIVAVEDIETTTPRGAYTYYRIAVDINKNIYQMDCKFSQKNFLINVLGNDVQDWIGKTVKIRLSEEGYRTFVL
jgi:hypothetical protein